MAIHWLHGRHDCVRSCRYVLTVDFMVVIVAEPYCKSRWNLNALHLLCTAVLFCVVSLNFESRCGNVSTSWPHFVPVLLAAPLAFLCAGLFGSRRDAPLPQN